MRSICSMCRPILKTWGPSYDQNNEKVNEHKSNEYFNVSVSDWLLRPLKESLNDFKMKYTGLRRLKHITVNNYFGDGFRIFSGYFLSFPSKIYVSEPDRKVREGLSLISSSFHPNPATGSPKSVKNVIPRDIFVINLKRKCKEI